MTILVDIQLRICHLIEIHLIAVQVTKQRYDYSSTSYTSLWQINVHFRSLTVDN